MPIPFRCPHCGITGTAKEKHIGRVVACPNCCGKVKIGTPPPPLSPAIPARKKEREEPGCELVHSAATQPHVSVEQHPQSSGSIWLGFFTVGLVLGTLMDLADIPKCWNVAHSHGYMWGREITAKVQSMSFVFAILGGIFVVAKIMLAWLYFKRSPSTPRFVIWLCATAISLKALRAVWSTVIVGPQFNILFFAIVFSATDAAWIQYFRKSKVVQQVFAPRPELN